MILPSAPCFHLLYSIRAINKVTNKIRPFFSENKSELKDALIWKTYSDFVESNNINTCILLTNNTTDFCTKNNKQKINPELVADSDRFMVFNSSFNFIRAHAKVLESPENRFKAYISQVDFSSIPVLNILQENFGDVIEERMHQEVDKLSPYDLSSSDYFFDGQLIPYGCELLGCENIEYETLSESLLIIGIVYTSCEVEMLEYNSVRDRGEDRYTSIGEKNITFKLYFNFDMRIDDIYSDFEITDIDISETY